MKTNFKLQIKDLVWSIKFVDRDNIKLDKACGVTYKEELKIYINESLKKELFLRTLRHEITHAFIWSYGLENIVVRDFEEEDICNFVETYGADICKFTEQIYNDYLTKKRGNR